MSKRESAANETLDQILSKGKAAAATPRAEAEPVPTAASQSGPDPGEADPTPELKSELLKGIHLRVRAELGRRSVRLKDALRLQAGSVVDLEKSGDDPVDLYVNDVLLARGVVTVVNDCFCIRVTEVLPPICEERQ